MIIISRSLLSCISRKFKFIQGVQVQTVQTVQTVQVVTALVIVADTYAFKTVLIIQMVQETQVV